MKSSKWTWIFSPFPGFLTLLVYKDMNMEMHRKFIHEKLSGVWKAILKQEMFIRVITILWVFDLWLKYFSHFSKKKKTTHLESLQ